MLAERLGAVLNRLTEKTGDDFTAEDFDSRLRIQKAVYLLRAFNVKPFGAYNYSRYISGPYCTDLAQHYYALKEGRAKPAREAPPIPTHAEAAVIDAIKRGNEFLEATTTLHFVAKQNRDDRAVTMKVVREIKPHLEESTIQEGWAFLTAHALIHART